MNKSKSRIANPITRLAWHGSILLVECDATRGFVRKAVYCTLVTSPTGHHTAMLRAPPVPIGKTRIISGTCASAKHGVIIATPDGLEMFSTLRSDFTKPTKTITKETLWLNSALTCGGDFAAAVSCSKGVYFINVWDLNRLRCVAAHTIASHGAPSNSKVKKLVWGAGDRVHLASLQEDGTLKVWTARGVEMRCYFDTCHVDEVAFFDGTFCYIDFDGNTFSVK